MNLDEEKYSNPKADVSIDLLLSNHKLRPIEETKNVQTLDHAEKFYGIELALNGEIVLP